MTAAPDLLRKVNKLQLHYWFGDKSHTMDALIHNKCERELLEITKAIATLCGASIKMETEPSARGGLKSWLTISAKSEKKTPPSKIALVTTLATACIVTPVNASIGKAANQLIDGLMTEGDTADDLREQLQQEVTRIKE
jgi:hypothetical protein